MRRGRLPQAEIVIGWTFAALFLALFCREKSRKLDKWAEWMERYRQADGARVEMELRALTAEARLRGDFNPDNTPVVRSWML